LNAPDALYPAESSLQADFPAKALTPERGNSPQRETLSNRIGAGDSVEGGKTMKHRRFGLAVWLPVLVAWQHGLGRSVAWTCAIISSEK